MSEDPIGDQVVGPVAEAMRPNVSGDVWWSWTSGPSGPGKALAGALPLDDDEVPDGA